MRISRKTQNTIKNVVSAVLAIAILLGVAAIFGGFADKDDLVKVNPVFTVGGLNEEGKYVENDGTIYTKEAFECQGLEIKLDFEKTIFYEIFFYTELGEYISSTGEINANSAPEVPVFATHARIVITPDWELLGDDYIDEEDQKIKWYEVAKYSSQVKVKVNKEQLSFAKLISKEESVYVLKGNGTWGNDGSLTPQASSPFYLSEVIDVSTANAIVIKLPTSELTKKATLNGVEYYTFMAFDSSNKIELSDKNNRSFYTVIDEEGSYSYVKIDCSEFSGFFFTTSQKSVDIVKCYLFS